MADEIEDGGPHAQATRVSHIKKRALKNKALAISFNEKDLRDYVTGFHKRKKKRRKVAHKQQEEAVRRKRIELRQKRRLEDEFHMDEGAPAAAEEIEEGDDEGAEESEPVASVSGTTMYDNGDLKVTVTTSEITREDDESGSKETTASTNPKPIIVKKKNQKLPVSRKPAFKKSSKRKTRAKTQTKRDKRKSKLPSRK